LHRHVYSVGRGCLQSEVQFCGGVPVGKESCALLACLLQNGALLTSCALVSIFCNLLATNKPGTPLSHVGTDC
jgi:hypothetical protein